MKGKEICRYLKDVRRRIAEENHIALEIPECTFEGECRGTCPRCEAEVRYLESALAQKSGWRQAFSVVGVAAGLTLGATGCSTQTQGEVSPPEPSKTEEVQNVPSSTDSLSADSAGNAQNRENLKHSCDILPTEFNGEIIATIPLLDTTEMLMGDISLDGYDEEELENQ